MRSLTPPDPATLFFAVKLGVMKKGQRYFKPGRTSGIAVGMCHVTEADILQNHHNTHTQKREGIERLLELSQ